ncbi:STM3941 family protein, partial [Lacticaseibacillus paracasei]
TDNASVLSAGFIPWSDIAGAGIVTFQEQKFLGISLKDPQKYLVKASFFKRLLMRINSSLVGYVVNIPQGILPVPVEELLAHIER